MRDVTENTLLAFGTDVGKLSKTQSNYWHGLHVRKRPHKYRMKNTSHEEAGHRHYFLKHYKYINFIKPIYKMLQSKKNIFISFFLYFNTNRFYEQRNIGVFKYSITKQMYINYRQNLKESSWQKLEFFFLQ
jgi:hypothetical protein